MYGILDAVDIDIWPPESSCHDGFAAVSGWTVEVELKLIGLNIDLNRCMTLACRLRQENDDQ